VNRDPVLAHYLKHYKERAGRWWCSVHGCRTNIDVGWDSPDTVRKSCSSGSSETAPAPSTLSRLKYSSQMSE
jgi:hypothetical protein